MPTIFKTAKEAEKAAKLAVQSTSEGFHLAAIDVEKAGDGYVAKLVVEQEGISEADRNAVIDHEVVTLQLPPAVAVGADINQITREEVQKTRREWLAKHGLITPEEAAKAKPIEIKSVPKDATYTFIGKENHRNKGGQGWAMINWLIKNPGSTRSAMVEAGFDAKHIRWDLMHNPQLFQIGTAAQLAAGAAPAPEATPASAEAATPATVEPAGAAEAPAPEAEPAGAAEAPAPEAAPEAKPAATVGGPEKQLGAARKKGQSKTQRQAALAAKVAAAPQS